MKIYKISKTEEYNSTQKNFDFAQEPDEGEIEEKLSDFYQEVESQHQKILQEYYNKKRKKGSMMSWDVVPFARLKKIWTDYSLTGVVRDVRGMQDIVDQMLRILAKLNASNDLSGHGTTPDGYIEEMTGLKIPHGKNSEFYFDFLNTKHGVPISDYGLPKLNEIAQALMVTRNPVEQLLLVDQMLNIVHQRGDLAALFIEGGTNSLNILKNK
jgi:hypothetical protein